MFSRRLDHKMDETGKGILVKFTLIVLLHVVDDEEELTFGQCNLTRSGRLFFLASNEEAKVS